MTGLFSRGLFSRSGWGRVMGPLIRWLVKHGVTANTVFHWSESWSSGIWRTIVRSGKLHQVSFPNTPAVLVSSVLPSPENARPMQ